MPDIECKVGDREGMGMSEGQRRESWKGKVKRRDKEREIGGEGRRKCGSENKREMKIDIIHIVYL